MSCALSSRGNVYPESDLSVGYKSFISDEQEKPIKDG